MKRLPIQVAKEIARVYKQSQVMLVTWDKEDKLVHTVSYGVTRQDSEEAAIGMKMIRKALNFPQNLIRQLPSRVSADYDRAEAALGMHEGSKPDSTLHHCIQNHRLAGIVAWGLHKLGKQPG